jgi:hypothetical protein
MEKVKVMEQSTVIEPEIAIQEHEPLMLSSLDEQRIKNARPLTQALISYKPQGFWYGRGITWLQYASRLPKASWKYLLKVDIDRNKLAVLNDERDVNKFVCQYATSSRRSSFTDCFLRVDTWHIDWAYVASRYSGIEVDCFCPELLHIPQFQWYNRWVIGSGCVWDTNAILSAERVALKQGR